MFTAYDKTIGRVVDAEDAKANGGKSHVFSGWFIDIMKSIYNIKASEDDVPEKKEKQLKYDLYEKTVRNRLNA